MIWEAIKAVFVIFIMIGAGIFVSWRKWVSREAAGSFPKIVIYLSLPCLIITSFSAFTRQQLSDAWLPLAIIFLLMPLSYVIGRLATRVFRIPKQRRGVFTVLFSFSNSVFIGFPVAQALFGDAGMEFAVYFYLANSIAFWLLGYYAIRRDADIINGKHSKVSVKEILSKTLSVPIVMVLVMTAFVMLEVRMPSIVTEPARYIGAMTSPLSLMFMGCIIYQYGVKGMKYEKGIGPVMLGRFVVIPAIVFGVCTMAAGLMEPGMVSMDLEMMRNVFTMQSALPVMTQTVIVSDLYGADTAYATKNVVWTTLAALLTIPAYRVLLMWI